jgi:two-component system cell cycle response regulator DivK
MSTQILVVEDDAQNSYLIGFILEKSGYEVVAAVDGEQAVAAVEAGRPDLILMDMLLPKMNGYEATKIIKARPDMEGVPIIALTAYSMKGDREKILEAGCDGYISKPIDPETFVSQMEEFLPPRQP